MPTITITPKDLLRSKILDPTWYRLKVEEALEEPTKKGDSTNYIIDFVVTKGPAQKDKDGTEFSPVGVPVRRYWNEKAPSFAVPFFIAFGVQFSLTESKTLRFEDTKGKEVDAYIVTGMDDKGKPQNQVEDFAPAGTHTSD